MRGNFHPGHRTLSGHHTTEAQWVHRELERKVSPSRLNFLSGGAKDSKGVFLELNSIVQRVTLPNDGDDVIGF
jgi:hypothetical protein